MLWRSFLVLGGPACLACLACRSAQDLDVVVGAGGSTTSSTVASTGGSGGTPHVVPQASLLTWNVEQFPQTSQTVARAAEDIQELAPTVMGMEEITSEAGLQELDDALPDYETLINDDPGNILRVGMLYRSADVTASEVETLFTNNSYAFPRPPLKAHLTIATDPPFDFVFIVVHLKAQLDADSVERRRQACQALASYIEGQQAAGTEQDFIVAGDFNDELTDAMAYNVFLAFIDKPSVFRFLTMPAAQANEYTYIPFQSFLDHILITTDVLTEYGQGDTQVLKLEQQEPDYQTVLSDHRPVFARFSP